MQNTKKLLSITNLKKYFPIAKSSIFQKEQLYVRANEDISLDIYEGETIGVVGESGCGKSTLGRVLLQLYPQTAGCTIYYGTTIDELAPKYVAKTLKNFNKYKKKLDKLTENRIALEEEVKKNGGEESADFYTLQKANIAKCEEDTLRLSIAKIVGGFMVVDDPEGIRLLLEVHKGNAKKNALKVKAANGDEKAANELKEVSASVETLKRELDKVKAKYVLNEQFAEYEKMLDDGIDLARLTVEEMRGLRQDLQIIFQDPYSSLNPRFTVGQIIEEGLVTHDLFKHGSPELREYIVDTMEKCGLQEYMLHRYPHQFSGGQRQRICIARALAVNPKFVVCDECVSALDVSIQSQIINLLQELKEKHNLTYMFISHDLSVVKFISDRIAVMYLGNIVELADKKTIFEDPRHPYTVALLSSIPTTDTDSSSKDRIILEGNIPSPVNPPAGCKFCTRCFMATEKCTRVAPPLVEIEPNHFCACHYPERKLSEDKKYLFERTK